MSWQPRGRRDRYGPLSQDQYLDALADDLDNLDHAQHDHVVEDEQAFDAITETLREWKLQALRSQNRTYLMVIVALIAVVGSVVTTVLTVVSTR